MTLISHQNSRLTYTPHEQSCLNEKLVPEKNITHGNQDNNETPNGQCLSFWTIQNDGAKKKLSSLVLKIGHKHKLNINLFKSIEIELNNAQLLTP